MQKREKTFWKRLFASQIVKMMDDEDGVTNRKKKKVAPGGGNATKMRKSAGLEARPLVDQVGEGGVEDNYLTVTSLDLRNWFKGITGGTRTLPGTS